VRARCSRTGVFLLLGLLFSGQLTYGQQREKGKKLWLISIFGLYAANYLDVHTSRHKFEANPILRGPDGRLSYGKALTVKFSIASAAVLTEYLVSRKSSWSERYWTSATTNFVAAGLMGAVAVHNTRVPRPQALGDSLGVTALQWRGPGAATRSSH